MSGVKEAIGVVENGRVIPPPEVRLPEGARVRLTWEEPEAVHPEPLEREPLTEEDIRADLEWATGKRFQR
jgi:hypothetical protein